TEVMPGTPAAKAGLQRGDVITAVAGQAVSDPRALREAIHRAEAGKEISLTVQRGREKKEIKARLEELPVEGISMLPLPFPPIGGTVNPGSLNAVEKVSELERKVQD